MQTYAVARQNMLDCQLLTNGITSPEVVEVFGKIPREMFLPADRQGMAYIDEDLPLAQGCCLEPLIQARLIQSLEAQTNHSTLNIGDMTGYSSALLSDLVSTVVTLESVPGTLDSARSTWDKLGCCNVVVVNGVASMGSPEHAPYDRILINGAVSVVPEILLDQLAVGGRLSAVVTERGKTVGSITVIEKIDEDKYSTSRLFDASTSYVLGFEPEASFTF